MAIDVGNLEFVGEFPKMLLEYFGGDEQVCLAVKALQSGQIRLNMNNGRIESIEIRQFARNKKRQA